MIAQFEKRAFATQQAPFGLYVSFGTVKNGVQRWTEPVTQSLFFLNSPVLRIGHKPSPAAAKSL